MIMTVLMKYNKQMSLLCYSTHEHSNQTQSHRQHTYIARIDSFEPNTDSVTHRTTCTHQTKKKKKLKCFVGAGGPKIGVYNVCETLLKTCMHPLSTRTRILARKRTHSRLLPHTRAHTYPQPHIRWATPHARTTRMGLRHRCPSHRRSRDSETENVEQSASVSVAVRNDCRSDSGIYRVLIM